MEKNKTFKKKNYIRVLIDYDQIKCYIKQTKICLDNEGAHLISPNDKNIKIGQINEWNYLKRK